MGTMEKMIYVGKYIGNILQLNNKSMILKKFFKIEIIIINKLRGKTHWKYFSIESTSLVS